MSVVYLASSCTGHLHIKGDLTLVLVGAWRPVRTEATQYNESKVRTHNNPPHPFKKPCQHPTCYRRNCSGSTRAVHPIISSPCLRCGWRTTTEHALVLLPGSPPSPRSPPWTLRHSHLVAQWQGLLEGGPEYLCSH